MKDYEILSRATAFLLQVDPPPDEQQPSQQIESSSDDHDVKKPAFPHLQENINIRNKLLRKQDYKYDPASGPPRLPHQLNWLEFCPTAFRPKVHVVASSHVISPWLWPKYYSQDWLKVIKQENVRYSLEVWGVDDGGRSSNKSTSSEAIRHDGKLQGEHKPLAKFALNPYPIHHPKEVDVALIHLKEEDSAMEHMMKLGIRPLHLPTMHELEQSTDPVFVPGETVLFQGYEVYEANTTDQETVSNETAAAGGKSDENDDERVFHPYSSLGSLTLASPDRFLARTKAGPIPEGLCGGPVIQLPNEMSEKFNKNTPLMMRGVIEGIVPANHENNELAGLASFIPSYRIREFVDFAERVMLEHIVEEDLFKRIVDLKERRDQRGTTYGSTEEGGVHKLDNDDGELPNDANLRAGIEGTSSDESDTPHIDSEYQEIVASLHQKHAPEEVDAILATVEREREAVIKILEAEGGDMDDVIEAVRRKTYEEKDRIMKEIEREMMGQKNIQEGEIVSSDEDKAKAS
jgi:hypothetical protein